ncbi:MAG: hypothetical protein R3362_06640 [Rhodothermales bacterium]|nr:hypothetical protein [Rhodothermales bacterium]
MLGTRLPFGLGALLAVAAVAAGCDSAPGPLPLDPRPPEVRAFAFSPDAALFDTLATSGDTASVTLALSAEVTDPDDAVAAVRYVVESRFDDVVAEGDLEAAGEDGWAGTVELALTRGQRGFYTVLVYAVDAQGLLSNQARGLFELVAPGLGPPEIVEIDAPETFRPPGTLRLVAVVEDPDGRSDVARVEVDTPAGGTLPLSDDGSSFGDEEAGDGRWTAAFDVPEAAPGPQTFVFRAFDRDGAASEDVPFTITILE